MPGPPPLWGQTLLLGPPPTQARNLDEPEGRLAPHTIDSQRSPAGKHRLTRSVAKSPRMLRPQYRSTSRDRGSPFLRIFRAYKGPCSLIWRNGTRVRGVLPRRALHALGFRYRVDLPLPGMRRRRSDLTFVRWRTVVFVQGCFWHACPQHMHALVHNAEWWREKFEGNVRRDTDTDTRLVRMGWVPLRIWEHEVIEAAVGKVVRALGEQGHPRALRILGAAAPRSV
ncbi:hypothetical protein AB0C48_07125 [Streptomyces sp. NPDC048556]|uniref:hypothetical protein n=1 Tax=Streptomyces sp. NPDC048556 TaxID=3156664 RepID=UPI003431D755